MAEPLRNIYDPPFLADFGKLVKGAYGAFDAEGFETEAMAGDWPELELKARMRRITETLGRHLPASYGDALSVLYAIAPRCKGFAYLIFPDFVERFGQAPADWELSMTALERFTPLSSSEFAVRPFLLAQPERMMERMKRWASHPDEHVRRLASEGCRPRLPWGQSLPMFKRDPKPVLELLELLKADPSLYVRKSVANNLNDIAKDHPDLVLETAARWQGAHPHTDWIIRHGCRTLVRRAVPGALALFGYADAGADGGAGPLVAEAAIAADPSAVSIGQTCVLHYALRAREGGPLRLRVEYGIDFIKSNGKASRKLFLLSDKIVPGGAALAGSRTHRWADLTTRRHYPGPHRIVLLVNGREAAETMLRLHAASGGGTDTEVELA